MSQVFIIIGGGIAGVSCAQEILRVKEQPCKVILISASETLMEVSMFHYGLLSSFFDH